MPIDFSNDPEAKWSPLKLPRLYKYVTLTRLHGILKDREIRVTQPEYLNDPHELGVAINAESLQVDAYKKYIKNGMSKLRAFDSVTRGIVDLAISFAEMIVEQRNDFGVLSLTQSPNNMLMWAHYGDEHRGAVIEIDAEQLISEKKSPSHVHALVEVEYHHERIDFIARQLPIWMTLIFKSTPWKYEEEWRLIRSLASLRQKTKEVFVLDLPPGAIKRVIFGARAQAVGEEPIYKLAKSEKDFEHVIFEKAHFSSSLAELEFSKLEEFGWLILHGEHHFGEHWRLVRQWVDLKTMQRAETGEAIKEQLDP